MSEESPAGGFAVDDPELSAPLRYPHARAAAAASAERRRIAEQRGPLDARPLQDYPVKFPPVGQDRRNSLGDGDAEGGAEDERGAAGGDEHPMSRDAANTHDEHGDAAFGHHGRTGGRAVRVRSRERVAGSVTAAHGSAAPNGAVVPTRPTGKPRRTAAPPAAPLATSLPGMSKVGTSVSASVPHTTGLGPHASTSKKFKGISSASMPPPPYRGLTDGGTSFTLTGHTGRYYLPSADLLNASDGLKGDVEVWPAGSVTRSPRSTLMQRRDTAGPAPPGRGRRPAGVEGPAGGVGAPESFESIEGTVESEPSTATVGGLKGRMPTQLGDQASLAADSLAPKPRFLQDLEAFVSQELEATGMTHAGPCAARMQVYREAFQYFIEDFKTYKSFLSAVKNEYELLLDKYSTRLHTIPPLKAQLATMKADAAKVLAAARTAHKKEVEELQAQLAEKQAEVDGLAQELHTTAAERDRLQSRNNHLESVHSEITQSHKTLVAALKRHEEIVRQKDRNLASLQGTAFELRNKLKAATLEAEMSAEQILELKDDMKKMLTVAEARAKDKEIRRLTKEAADAKSRYEDLSTEHSAAIEKMRALSERAKAFEKDRDRVTALEEATRHKPPASWLVQFAALLNVPLNADEKQEGPSFLERHQKEAQGLRAHGEGAARGLMRTMTSTNSPRTSSMHGRAVLMSRGSTPASRGRSPSPAIPEERAVRKSRSGRRSRSRRSPSPSRKRSRGKRSRSPSRSRSRSPSRTPSPTLTRAVNRNGDSVKLDAEDLLRRLIAAIEELRDGAARDAGASRIARAPTFMSTRVAGGAAPHAGGGTPRNASSAGLQGGAAGSAAGEAAVTSPGADGEKTAPNSGGLGGVAPPPDPRVSDVEFERAIGPLQLLVRHERFFKGLGTELTVPRYLRASGTIPNRRMHKRAAERMAKEIWVAKQRAGDEGSLADFVADFLESKYTPNEAIERAYNLVDALRRFEYDADLSLFLKVLQGQLPEEVQSEGLLLLQKLKAAFVERDRELHAGTLTRKLPGPEIIKIVTTMVPAKGTDAVTELVQALAADCADPLVPYTDLLEEDAAGDQGAFCEALRDQHLAEYEEFVADLRESLADATEESLSPTGDRTVSVKDAREAIARVDPVKPAREVLELVARGFRLTPEDLLTRDDRKMPLTSFQHNLFHKGWLARTGKRHAG